MKDFFRVVIAEAGKQHRNYFYSKTIYISLFIWPVLEFMTAYFGYKAFDFSGVMVDYLTEDNIILYLLLGYMCLSYFKSLVQSAWRYSMERTSGTLELVFLSPANRFALILGNAVSSLFESIVVMFVFSAFLFAWHREQLHMLLAPALCVFLLLNLLAVLWGVFLNALFLYSRDTDFLFTILESPMEIFAGVKVPVALFPSWAKVIAAIFPLTYVLEAVRKTVLNGATLWDLSVELLKGVGIALLLFIGALVALKGVEKHIRKTGNLTQY